MKEPQVSICVFLAAMALSFGLGVMFAGGFLGSHEWVSAGANAVMAGAAVAGVIAAIVGYQHWKTELHGRNRYDFVSNLIELLRAAFDDVKFSRCFAMTVENAQDPNKGEARAALGHFYKSRYEALLERAIKFSAARRKGDFFLPAETLNKLDGLDSLILDFRIQLQFLSSCLSNEAGSILDDVRLSNAIEVCCPIAGKADKWWDTFEANFKTLESELLSELRP